MAILSSIFLACITFEVFLTKLIGDEGGERGGGGIDGWTRDAAGADFLPFPLSFLGSIGFGNDLS